MFYIRKLDFAMLYRAHNNFHPKDVQAEKDFRRRNPECPEILNAPTYKEALDLNRQLFFYV